MKIVQVLYSFALAGSETLAKNIAIGLTDRGQDCYLCALDKGGPIEKELEANNITYYVINRKPGQRLFTMYKVYKFLKKIRPDVVHTHHLSSLYYSLIGAILAGARIVHTEHDYFSFLSRKSRIALRVLSIFCKKITTVSESITEFLRTKVGIPSEKLVTIINGIDLERFRAGKPVNKTTLFGIRESDRTIGVVATLEKRKDHITLLEAFRTVQEKIENVKLLIIGEGSLRQILEDECRRLGIDKNVRFLGGRRDIPELLSLLDVFVLPSLDEGLPLSILEAMASGAPVIATNVGSVPSIVKDGVTGLLVQPKNPAELANAITRILDNGNMALSLKKAARHLVEERYGFEKCLQAYITVYTG